MKTILLIVVFCLALYSQAFADENEDVWVIDITTPLGLYGLKRISTDNEGKHGFMLGFKARGSSVRGDEMDISRYLVEEIFEDRFDGKTTAYLIGEIGIIPNKGNFFVGCGLGYKWV